MISRRNTMLVSLSSAVRSPTRSSSTAFASASTRRRSIACHRNSPNTIIAAPAAAACNPASRRAGATSTIASPRIWITGRSCTTCRPLCGRYGPQSSRHNSCPARKTCANGGAAPSGGTSPTSPSRRCQNKSSDRFEMNTSPASSTKNTAGRSPRQFSSTFSMSTTTTRTPATRPSGPKLGEAK